MSDKTILLVDDNDDDVVLTERALKRNNIANKVVVAKDGQEALDYLFGRGKYMGRDLNQMPVVTLLDINMPRVSGFEVLKEVRSNPRTKLLPIVCLTSSRQERDIIKSYQEGSNAYVTKPVDFEQFAEAVRQLGLFWLVLNEPPPQVT